MEEDKAEDLSRSSIHKLAKADSRFRFHPYTAALHQIKPEQET
jgi:hypothetical protein